MGQIKNTNKYPFDQSISGNESVIGSDFDENGKTKNYKLSSLAAYFTQYFNSQNQTVSLTGEITGGNGTVLVPTTAQPSIIANRPITTDFTEENTFLYLDNGVLSQISWGSIYQVIVEQGGGYTPPTYTPINLSGGGLSFVRSLQTNIYGHTIGASMGTIQDAGPTQKGVVREATPSEYYTNMTGVYLPPAALQGLTGGISGSGTAGTLPVFVTPTGISDSIVRQNGTSIGVGIVPVSGGERLQVDGETLADGYRTPNNNQDHLLNSAGGEVIGSDEIIVSGNQLLYETVNLFTGNGAYVIPDTRNKTIYVTYDGTNAGSNDSVTLPINPIVGQRVYIFHGSENATGTITIHSPNTVFEFDIFTGFIFYYNGNRWLCYGRLNVLAG